MGLSCRYVGYKHQFPISLCRNRDINLFTEDIISASYSEPASSYGEPAASYGEPAPAYGADEAALPDLTPIIIGILALVGLSLLFPQRVNVDVKRRKRDAEDANPMTDVVELVNEIYNSVITSEQCMERIACELGGLASMLV